MDEKRSRDGFKVWLLVAVIVLPCLYVLSIGPAFRLVCDGKLDLEIYKIVYRPVHSAYSIRPVEDTVNAYTKCWLKPITYAPSAGLSEPPQR
jgi:hypothetical protein